MLTADSLYCLLGGTERHISTPLKLYWQVSRTDGHSVDECVREWLLVKGLADRGPHQPINQGCLATSGRCRRPAKAFIMKPQGRRVCVCVCVCVCVSDLWEHTWLSLKNRTVKGTAHISHSVSSYQYLTLAFKPSDPPSHKHNFKIWWLSGSLYHYWFFNVSSDIKLEKLSADLFGAFEADDCCHVVMTIS